MKLFLLACLVAAASASGYGGYDDGYGYDVDYDAHPDYHTAYSIKDKYSGVDVDSQENRYGDQTEGSYHVALPDGRQQHVDYWVDKDSGYVADVNYVGVAHHPKTPIKIRGPDIVVKGGYGGYGGYGGKGGYGDYRDYGGYGSYGGYGDYGGYGGYKGYGGYGH